MRFLGFAMAAIAALVVCTSSADARIVCDRFDHCRNVVTPPHVRQIPRFYYADRNVYRPQYGHQLRYGAYGRHNNRIVRVQRWHREYTVHHGGYSSAPIATNVPTAIEAFRSARHHHRRGCVPCAGGYDQDLDSCECTKVTYHPGK